MKTPKRTRATVSQFVTSQACKNARARYKRKNRTAQLKRSLTRKNKEIDNLKRMAKLVQKLIDIVLDDNTSDIEIHAKWKTKDELRAQKREERIKRREIRRRWRAVREDCYPENTENGQQTELPPAGRQRACLAQTAEKATQNNLLCTAAEQLSTRKGN